MHGWGRPLQKRLDPQNGASPSFKETQILHWIGRCRADECFRISKVSISLQPVMLVYWRGILRKSLAAMVYCVIPIMSRRPSVDLDRWPGDAEVHFFLFSMIDLVSRNEIRQFFAPRRLRNRRRFHSDGGSAGLGSFVGDPVDEAPETVFLNVNYRA